MPSVARLGMITATAAVAVLLAVAVRAERVLGDAGRPWVTFDVHVPGGEARRSGDLVRTWRERLPDYHVVTSRVPPAQPGAITVRVEVFGAGAADTAEVLAALTASARLELRAIVSDSETSRRWFRAVRETPPSELADIEMEIDSWVDPVDRARYDYYVKGADLAAVTGAVERLARDTPLPQGVTVVYERVVPSAHDDGAREPYYRSYLVSDEVIITNDHLASGGVTYDPNTLLPEVSVELTADGRRRFGDATAAMVGDKLAILLDREVRSAPVVMGAIRGGRTTITMGGETAQEMEAEATRLAAALSPSSRLPDGLDATLVGTHGGSAGLVWLVRGLVGLIAGALAAWLAVLAERRRWFVAAPSVMAAPLGNRGATTRWSAVVVPAAITAGVPLALWFAARELVLPFVNEVELQNVVAGAGDPALFGVFALGIMPVVSAFVLVELFAVGLEQLLPGRRDRRLGAPAGRRDLDLAAWLTAVALAGMQAYLLASYLDDLALHRAEVLTSDAAVPLLVLTLTAGVMVQVVAAELISRHGLCNGYLALLGAGAGATLVELLDRPVPPGGGFPERAVVVAIFVAAAFAAVVATRQRSVTASGLGPRLPYTGAVPASMVRGGLGLVALAAVWSPWVAERLQQLGEWAPVLELAATVPLAGLILWTARRPWSGPGVAATFAFLVPLVLLPFLVDAPFRVGVPIADGVLFGLVLSELTVGARARAQLAGATTVLVVHDVFAADDAADRLASAGIPHAVLGARARAALRMFGAFVPVELRVPSARADDARAALVR